VALRLRKPGRGGKQRGDNNCDNGRRSHEFVLIRRDFSRCLVARRLVKPLKGLANYGSCSYPSPKPFKLIGNPIPSSGVWKMMKVEVWPVRNCLIKLSSITTSATQPFGRQRTKPARPTS